MADMCSNLARFYEEGVGVAVDVVRAASYYRAGAVRDDSHACFMLGRLLEQGKVEGRREALAAVELFERAARLGNAEAAAALARMVQAGDGTQRDPEKAMRLYAEAANGGCLQAMLTLAQLHARGQRRSHARSPDPKAARRYLEMAAEAGHQPSVKRVAALREKEAKGREAKSKEARAEAKAEVETETCRDKSRDRDRGRQRKETKRQTDVGVVPSGNKEGSVIAWIKLG